jgi:hypothetical protein
MISRESLRLYKMSSLHELKLTNLGVVAPLVGYVEGGLNGTAVGIESSSKQLLIESLK